MFTLDPCKQVPAILFIARIPSQQGVYSVPIAISPECNRVINQPQNLHMYCVHALLKQVASFIQLVVEFYEIKITLFLAVRVTRLN